MKNFLAIIVLSITIIGATASENDKKSESNAEIKTTAIHGVIKDASTDELLTGVAIKVEGLEKTYYSDFNGKYYITDIEPGEYNIIYSYISYQKKKEEKIIVKNTEQVEINLLMNTIK